jgi:hypothetical protein
LKEKYNREYTGALLNKNKNKKLNLKKYIVKPPVLVNDSLLS